MILDLKFLDPDKGFVFAGTSSDVAKSNAFILETRDGGTYVERGYRSNRPHEIIWKASFPPLIVHAGIEEFGVGFADELHDWVGS